jgi:tripartite ATP-independent transporter DctM subunit
MNIGLVTGLMFGLMLLFLASGLPLTFCLGSIGVGFALWLYGTQRSVDILVYNMYGIMGSFVLVAIPLFLFTGIVLERSGIADDLYEAIYKWMGGLRGGLGMGTIIICAIIAAIVGVSGAATVTMGLIALPSMIKRGYNKIMMTGAIQAGGALGFLIPPSVVMILYALIAKTSVGKLFAGGIGPGLLLTAFYIAYIGIRCHLQPELGPALPPEDRASWREKFLSLRGLILPAILIIMVLGFIIFGVTSPTEASATGAIGALLCAAIHRRLNWTNFREAVYRTFSVTGMVMWVLISAVSFAAIYDALGATKLIENILSGSALGAYGTLAVMQLSFFILGCFLDDTAILFITGPVYIPLVRDLGFDPTWFGILYVINMQMAFLTPPYGMCLFYMKGVASDLFRTGTITQEITMGDIYRSVWPFVAMQACGLVVVLIFPQVALWIPSLVF